MTIKNKFILLLFVCTTLSATAQTSSIDSLKKILDDQKASKKIAEDQIKTTEAAIAKLTPPIIWTKGGFVALNLGQTALINWAAGGNSNFSGTIVVNYFANYRKGKHSWNNSFDGKWGLIKNHDFVTGKGDPVRKNEDFLQVMTNYSYDLTSSGRFQAGFLADFQSQFTATFNPTNDTQLVSRFMAPAYLKLGPFIGYKFTSYFKFTFSPASGKITFVNDPTIAASKVYTPNGEAVRTEIGAYLTAMFEKEIVKNIKLKSQLDLFNNYLNSEVDFNGKSKRANIDVNWRNDLFMRVNKYIGVTISTALIYDEDQKVTIGTEKKPRTQFRENLGIGLSYNF